MKFKYIIPAVAAMLFSSFAIVDVLSTIQLNKTQLSDRILKEIEEENPGGFLEINLNHVPNFGLTVTKTDFQSINASNYRAQMTDFKIQVMEIMKSEAFQIQWEAWLSTMNLTRADNLHDLALSIVKLSPYSPGTADEMLDKVNSVINSQNDNIKDIDSQLKTGGLPPGAITNRQNERKKAIAQLNAANAVKEKQPAGNVAFKSAFIIWDQTNDVLNDLDGIDNELNSIKTDMESWKYGVGPDHKKEVLASKTVFEGKRALIVQLLDKKKISDAVFIEAYTNYVNEKLVADKITTLTPADLQDRKDKRNPYLRLKKIMQVFIAQTDDIDFKATLTDKNQFTNTEYEGKPPVWKFYFRRGEVFTTTAREITRQWMSELK